MGFLIGIIVLRFIMAVLGHSVNYSVNERHTQMTVCLFEGFHSQVRRNIRLTEHATVSRCLREGLSGIIRIIPELGVVCVDSRGCLPYTHRNYKASGYET